MKRTGIFDKGQLIQFCISILLLMLVALPLSAFKGKMSRNESCPICGQINENTSGSFGSYDKSFFAFPFEYAYFLNQGFLYHCSQCHFTIFSREFDKLSGKEKWVNKNELTPAISAIATLLKKTDTSWQQQPGIPLSKSAQLECLLDIYSLLLEKHKTILDEFLKTEIEEMIYSKLAYEYALTGEREKAAKAADKVIQILSGRLTKFRTDKEPNNNWIPFTTFDLLYQIAFMHHCADRDSKALVFYQRLQGEIRNILDKEDISREVSFRQQFSRKRSIQNSITADVLGVLKNQPFKNNRSVTPAVKLQGVSLLVLCVTGLDGRALLLAIFFWLLLFLAMAILMNRGYHFNKLPQVGSSDFLLLIYGSLLSLSVYLLQGFVLRPALLLPLVLLAILWTIVMVTAKDVNGKAIFGPHANSSAASRGLFLLFISIPLAIAMVQLFLVAWGSLMAFLFLTVLWAGLTLLVENLCSRFSWCGKGAIFSTKAWYRIRLGIIGTPFLFGLCQWPQDIFSWLWTLEIKHCPVNNNPQYFESIWDSIIQWPYLDIFWEPSSPAAFHFILSLAVLGLLLIMMIVLYKHFALLRKPFFLLPLVLLAEYGLGSFASSGFPLLFYIIMAFVWFFYLLLLEYVVIRQAPWDGGDMAWAKKMVTISNWKWLRLIVAFSPLLIGPITAPGGKEFFSELLAKLF